MQSAQVYNLLILHDVQPMLFLKLYAEIVLSQIITIIFKKECIIDLFTKSLTCLFKQPKNFICLDLRDFARGTIMK